MKKYERQNRPWLIGALGSVLAASLFGVALQFFKGEVLDSAIAGQGARTLGYGLALAGFILGEVVFFHLYRGSVRCGLRHGPEAGCVRECPAAGLRGLQGAHAGGVRGEVHRRGRRHPCPAVLYATAVLGDRL